MATNGQFYWPSVGTFVAAYGQFFMAANTRGDTYFRQAGIQVQPQVYLERVGYVDLLLDGWLVVELDGRHHAEWKQVQKDHRRNNESVLQGYTALRYYYADVVYGPQAMVKQGLRHAAAAALTCRRRHAEQVFAFPAPTQPRELRGCVLRHC